MLDGVVQSVNDANERSRQTLQPYQSLWLAHWKRTDCNAELDCMASEDGLTKGLEASSRSANGLGRIKNRTFETGDDFIKAGRKSVGNERMFSSVFKDGQVADDVQVISLELAQNVECSKAVHNRSGIHSSGFHSVEEDTSDNPPELMRICSARKDSLFRLNPSQEIFLESPSCTLPYKLDVEVDKFDRGKAAISVGSRQRSGDMRMLEHEQRCQRKVGSPSKLDNSSSECFKESISCGHSWSMINRGWFMEMQKSSGIRLFPSQSNSSEEYVTKKSHNDCYSQLKLQNVHGLGTMTICTAVDVSGGTIAGFPRLSQTNNDLLTTKTTDVNTFKENDTFRCRRVFTKINGNMSGELHSILPFFGQNNLKVQLQSRGCLSDSELKEYIRDVKASKVTIRNELSAETDSMSMDSFKAKKYKNLHSASDLTASAKTFNMESTEVPSREVGYGRINYKLPDINLKPDAASLSENTSPSSSRSLSLETEKLVERVKQPKVKYNSSLDESPNADAGNRWVKRLKLSSSNSYIQGVKSSSFYSSSYNESRSKLFSGIPKSNTTSSTRNIETADDKGKALLSHGWIRRWRRIKSNENSEVEGIESPKFTVEKLHKGQFPSIAAMALMAKALTCFQQCELQKKGSYTIWNTKTL